MALGLLFSPRIDRIIKVFGNFFCRVRNSSDLSAEGLGFFPFCLSPNPPGPSTLLFHIQQLAKTVADHVYNPLRTFREITTSDLIDRFALPRLAILKS